MEININNILSEQELKDIVIDEVRSHIRHSMGDSVSGDNATRMISQLARTLAKEGIQELIPNFTELLNEHIAETIKSIKLSDFFVSSFGWSNPGNKVLNSVLSDNKQLLDAKVKEIFAPLDTKK